jgi:hypothetical protein
VRGQKWLYRVSAKPRKRKGLLSVVFGDSPEFFSLLTNYPWLCSCVSDSRDHNHHATCSDQQSAQEKRQELSIYDRVQADSKGYGRETDHDTAHDLEEGTRKIKIRSATPAADSARFNRGLAISAEIHCVFISQELGQSLRVRNARGPSLCSSDNTLTQIPEVGRGEAGRDCPNYKPPLFEMKSTR